MFLLFFPLLGFFLGFFLVFLFFLPAEPSPETNGWVTSMGRRNEFFFPPERSPETNSCHIQNGGSPERSPETNGCVSLPVSRLKQMGFLPCAVSPWRKREDISSGDSLCNQKREIKDILKQIEGFSDLHVHRLATQSRGKQMGLRANTLTGISKTP